MELRQLQYFVAVAEEKSFTRAAKRLHVSQPPLSIQIKKLEDEFNVDLITRTSRSVRLTALGETFYEQAIHILDKIQCAEDFCRKSTRGEYGELIIGYVPTAIEMRIAEILKCYTERYPEVRLRLKKMVSSDQLSALRSGRISVGFVRSSCNELEGISRKQVASEEHWLAIPVDHEIAHMESVPIEALECVNLILPSSSQHTGIAAAVIGICRQAGFEPRVHIESFEYQSALALVAAGIGITYIPSALTIRELDGVVYRPTCASWPKICIDMVWRPDDSSPVLHEFIDFIR